MNDVLTILLVSSLAALAAALGTLPLAGRDRLPTVWLGWANAVAAGLMLGAAYALAIDGFEVRPVFAAAGALLGVVFVWWTHRFAGTAELPLNELGRQAPEYGYQVMTIQTMHSASEGVAIGVAAVVDLTFGVFMAFTFAIHNVAEAMVLSAVLRSRGVATGQAATLSVVTNVSQVLLAVVTLSVVTAAPGILELAIGFAVGTLVHLVMVELLPEAYRQAGDPSIAVLTSVAVGVIALIQGLLR